MSGYLDQYGAGEERRIRIIKTLVISLVVLMVVGGTLLYVFYNYRQEQQVKRFFSLLQAHDYQGAYEMWVRTADDRKGYPFQSFLQDWGPQRRARRRRQLSHRQEPFVRLRRYPDGRFRHQPAGKALGAAGRPDDRIFSAPRLPGAPLAR